jgi:hypothetical protein
MTKINEIFGLKTTKDHEWSKIVAAQQCPFLGRTCYKIRKSNSSLAIGTCVVTHSGEPIIICPTRLIERRQIFTDCLHLLTSHEPGNELHVVSEVSVPGGSVDYFLVSAREGTPKDFVGIELQTLDSTGTVWPERQRFLSSVGIPVDPSDAASGKGYGMNWKMTAKTILMQLHHKVQTFEHVNKHLVLVIQDKLFDYMKREFSFDHVGSARTGDSMHIHAYQYKLGVKSNSLLLAERYSTDADGMGRALGLQSDAKVELVMILQALKSKMSAATLFQI